MLRLHSKSIMKINAVLLIFLILRFRKLFIFLKTKF